MAAKKSNPLETGILPTADAPSATEEIKTSDDIDPVPDDEVIAVVPAGFILNLDHHRQILYKAGTYKMPKAHAEHRWAKANGVTIFNEES